MQNFFAPPVFEDEEKSRIARIQNSILLAGIGLLIILTTIRFFRPDGGFGNLLTVNVVLLALFVGTKFLLQRGFVTASSLIIVLGVWVVLTFQAWSADGIRDTAFYGYIIVIILAFALLNWQAGAGIVALSIASGFALAYAEENGLLVPAISLPINIAFDVTVLFGLSGMGLGLIINGLNVALKRARQVESSLTESNRELKLLSDTLEDRVAVRIQRLEMLTAVNEQLSAILNLDELLNRVVTELNQTFNYQHAYIYLLNDTAQTMIATAGVGTAAAQLVAEQHRVRVDAPVSLMARAVRTRRIVQVSDVRQAPDWLPNPHLTDTRSEMAVPIMLSDKVVGVLDVQSTQVSDFDDVDTALMRLLANHIGVAMNNARLFRQVETSLAEAETIQRQYLEQAWDQQKVARQSSGRVQFSLGESTTLDTNVISQARHKAFANASPVRLSVQTTPSAETDSNPQDIWAMPLKLRDVIIGALQFHNLDPNRDWTENEQALIDAVVDQVVQAAENLRLLNETQERASREQLIGQISDKLQRAPDFESLMKIGVEEIARALGPGRTFVRMGVESQLQPDANQQPAPTAAAPPNTAPQSGQPVSSRHGSTADYTNGQRDKNL